MGRFKNAALSAMGPEATAPAALKGLVMAHQERRTAPGSRSSSQGHSGVPENLISI